MSTYVDELLELGELEVLGRSGDSMEMEYGINTYVDEELVWLTE